MSEDFCPYKQNCKCGHDISTHFREPDGKRGACLGMRCDDCKAFVSEWEPAPATKRMAEPSAKPVDLFEGLGSFKGPFWPP